MASFFGGQGGEIWSMSGINFGSNLSDILEKDNFTLEELLVEDELLQEIKSKNPVLIDFLSHPETVDAMVRHVTLPGDDPSDELVYFKYPYMSCEVFCCEVPSVLQMLVEEEDGKYFTKLLSVLDTKGPLNHYLAGYVEKIVDMLFRQKTIPVMIYLNKHGISLFQKFLDHIDNYSIMQIVQRLMLPHIPFSLETSDLDMLSPFERDNCTCDWSFQPDTCGMLVDRMLQANCHPDIPSHVSELLITVIQLSPPDAPFLSHLCEDRCLKPLVSHIALESSVTDTLNSLERELITAKSLAVISVLDSLLSRMCEAYEPSASVSAEGELHRSLSNTSDGAPNPMLTAAARIAEGSASMDASGMTDAEMYLQIQKKVKENIDLLCEAILPMLPKIGSMLREHLVSPSQILRSAQSAPMSAEGEEQSDSATMEVVDETPVPDNFIVHQSKFPFPRLGHHGLKLVKLTESIVRLSSPTIDEALVASGALETCVKLMFQYELHSLLHLSVQRMVVMVLEGGESRRLAQRNILIYGGLLQKLMDSFKKPDSAEDETWNGVRNRFANCGKPVMGHVIHIIQVLVRALHAETPEGVRENRAMLDETAISGVTVEDSSFEQSPVKNEDEIWTVVEGTASMGKPQYPRYVPKNPLRNVIDENGLGEEWDSFVENEFKRAMDVQLHGAADGGSVYSTSEAGGASPELEDSGHHHMGNALRALAGYSGFDGNLANRWPAADSDFVIINEMEDDDDDDEDYAYDWASVRQGITGEAMNTHVSPPKGTVRYVNIPKVDQIGTSASTSAKADDLFGSSTSHVDIFADEGAAPSTDFFNASFPTSTVPSEGVNSNSAFFDAFGEASTGGDFFTQPGLTNSEDNVQQNTSLDFFGNAGNVFSFASLPTGVGVTDRISQSAPTGDEKRTSDMEC